MYNEISYFHGRGGGASNKHAEDRSAPVDREMSEGHTHRRSHAHAERYEDGALPKQARRLAHDDAHGGPAAIPPDAQSGHEHMHDYSGEMDLPPRSDRESFVAGLPPLSGDSHDVSGRYTGSGHVYGSRYPGGGSGSGGYSYSSQYGFDDRDRGRNSYYPPQVQQMPGGRGGPIPEPRGHVTVEGRLDYIEQRIAELTTSMVDFRGDVNKMFREMFRMLSSTRERVPVDGTASLTPHQLPTPTQRPGLPPPHTQQQQPPHAHNNARHDDSPTPQRPPLQQQGQPTHTAHRTSVDASRGDGKTPAETQPRKKVRTMIAVPKEGDKGATAVTGDAASGNTEGSPSATHVTVGSAKKATPRAGDDETSRLGVRTGAVRVYNNHGILTGKGYVKAPSGEITAASIGNVPGTATDAGAGTGAARLDGDSARRALTEGGASGLSTPSQRQPGSTATSRYEMDASTKGPTHAQTKPTGHPIPRAAVGSYLLQLQKADLPVGRPGSGEGESRKRKNEADAEDDEPADKRPRYNLKVSASGARPVGLRHIIRLARSTVSNLRMKRRKQQPNLDIICSEQAMSNSGTTCLYPGCERNGVPLGSFRGLQVHWIRHLKDSRIFPCDFCDCWFPQQSAQLRHESEVHQHGVWRRLLAELVKMPRELRLQLPEELREEIDLAEANGAISDTEDSPGAPPLQLARVKASNTDSANSASANDDGECDHVTPVPGTAGSSEAASVPVDVVMSDVADDEKDEKGEKEEGISEPLVPVKITGVESNKATVDESVAVDSNSPPQKRNVEKDADAKEAQHKAIEDAKEKDIEREKKKDAEGDKSERDRDVDVDADAEDDKDKSGGEKNTPTVRLIVSRRQRPSRPATRPTVEHPIGDASEGDTPTAGKSDAKADSKAAHESDPKPSVAGGLRPRGTLTRRMILDV